MLINFSKKLNWMNLRIVETLSDEEAVELNAKVLRLLNEFDDFMNDDFSTAKVLANMFELVPVINGIKDKHISTGTLATNTLQQLQEKMKLFVEEVFGLKDEQEGDIGKLDGIIQVLIDLRKQARSKKDFATSDTIRNQLLQLGISIKDEKDGNMSYSFI